MATEKKPEKEPEKEPDKKFELSLKEKLLVNDSFFTVHIDFQNTPPSAFTYKELFESRFGKDSIEGSKRQFWFNLLFASWRPDYNITDPSARENEILSMLETIDINIEGFEARTKKNFAYNLKKIIIEKRGYTSTFFNFKLTNISYGSLDLLIEVTNVKNLADKFNDNLDFLIGFLEMYAPLVFIQSVGFSRHEEDLLYSTVDISKQFNAQFHNNENKADTEVSQNNKLERFLTLVKFSWVVPILLSLLLIYTLYLDTKEVKSFYLNNYNSILEHQNELLKSQNEFLKIELEHIKKYYDAKFIIDSSKTPVVPRPNANAQ